MKGRTSMNTDIFRPTTATGKFLLWLWDMIDISENMGRIEDWVFTISNGFSSALHLGVFAVLAVAAGALTWYFDLESTIIGMSGVTNVVVPSLPGQVTHLASYVILAITLMPTLLELFTSGMAKFNIKIVQIAIILFTLFDMVTDIPRSYQLAMGMWPQIQAMGWGVSHLTFWSYFLGWLFFATLGFELGFVIFAYASLLFFLKTFRGEGSFNYAPKRGKVPSRSRGPATRTTTNIGGMSGIDGMTSDDDVVIIG